MKEKEKFIAASKEYQRSLKRFLGKNYGKRCGHIGKDNVSLDCVVCKAWLFYDLFVWFLENQEDTLEWLKKEK